MNAILRAPVFCRAIGIFFIFFTNFASAESLINKQLPNVDKVFFTELTNAGNSIFIVGENGSLFRSEDQGHTWNPLKLDSTELLTSIDFFDAKNGVLVGHESTMYITNDGGKTFKKVFLKDLADRQALMKVRWLSREKLIVVGEFGLVITSTDSGVTWKTEKVSTTFFDRHLYDIIPLKSGIVLVGESGTLIFRGSNSSSWISISTPYKGSFFGGILGKDNTLFLYGMRGSIYRTSIRLVGGENGVKKLKFTRIDALVNNTLSYAIRLESGSIVFFDLKSGIVLVGESGTLIFRGSNSSSWISISTPYKGSFFGGILGKDNTLFLYGMRGSIYRTSIRLVGGENGVKKLKFTRIDALVNNTLSYAIRLESGSIVFFDNGSNAIFYENNKISIKKVSVDTVTGSFELPNNTLLMVGFRGMGKLNF